MVVFFQNGASAVTAVETLHPFDETALERLTWLLSGARPLKTKTLKGTFVGPRREMITPWSTNAVEITRNMGVDGIVRMEEFTKVKSGEPVYDKMLQRVYDRLDQNIFRIDAEPAPIEHIEDIDEYDLREGPLQRKTLSAVSQRDSDARSPIRRCSVFPRLTPSIAATRSSTVHS